MADTDYPQALIDRLGEAPEGQLEPYVSKRFAGRGPDNRMTYVEVYGITALCCHCALASNFVMKVLHVIEDDLIKTEDLTPADVQRVKDEFDLDELLKAGISKVA